MNRRTFTQYFMLGTFLLWGVLDLFLYFKYGNAATESATTWRDGYFSAGLTFSIGALMGHFFGQWRAPAPQTVQAPWYRRTGEVILLILMGVWLSVDGWYGIHLHTLSPVDGIVWPLTGHRVWVMFFCGFGLGSLFLPMDEPTAF